VATLLGHTVSGGQGSHPDQPAVRGIATKENFSTE